MKTFSLKIVTPDGCMFDGEAVSIIAKTDTGEVEILAGHTEYFAALGTGRVRIRTEGGDRLASSSGGFISVTPKSVTLVPTTFEFADEIDVNRAVLAKEKAEAAISRAMDERANAIAKAKLSRALNRISVAQSASGRK